MKIAWLFPGQGAQKVGMGASLYETSAAARAIYDEADRVLGFSIRKLCFEGPEAELTLTANLQPALLTTSIAILRALEETWPELPVPAWVAGHSLGEYSALVAAGAFDFADAVRLVRLRGEAMQVAVPQGEGAMLAVMGGSRTDVEALCEDARGADVLAPANYNCPGQIVIAGSSVAIARAQQLAKERKLKAIALKVSAPFHCALMRPAAEAMHRALSDVTVHPLQYPVVTNVEARPNADAQRVRDLLVRQIDGSVLWEQSMCWMGEQGLTHALEIGPGRVLAGLGKKTLPQLSFMNVNDSRSVQDVGNQLPLPG